MSTAVPRPGPWCWAIALLALLVSLPAIRHPLSKDDLLLRERLLAPELSEPRHYGSRLVSPNSHQLGAAVQHLFEWCGPGRPAAAAALVADGIFPWWTDERFSIAFWRPLASFTHWLDFRLWPMATSAMHLHGMIWFAAAAAAATALYQRLLAREPRGSQAAVLAAALWVVDPPSVAAVSWISSRNIVLAIAFGVLAVAAHDAWRRRGSRAAGFAAPAFYAMALLSCEAAVAITAYFAAYAACLDRASRRSRLFSLAPAAAVTLAWQGLYQLQGFGVQASGLYLDPLREPWLSLQTVVGSAPVLLAGQLGAPEARLWNELAAGARPVYWASCLALLAALALAFYPLLRASAAARFWALGMVLSLPPFCLASEGTHRRSSFFIGFGAMALIALWLIGAWRDAPWRAERGGAGRVRRVAVIGLAAVLLWIHAVVPIRAAGLRLVSRPPTGSHPYLDIGSDPALVDEEVVLITAPSPFYTVFLPWERAQAREPIPRRLRVLAPALSAVEVTRTAPGELVLRAATGSLMRSQGLSGSALAGEIWRLQQSNHAGWRGDFPVPAGSRRVLPGITVEVLQADRSGLPVAVRVHFDQPLEAPGRRWLVWSWQQRRYLPFTAPPIGRMVTIPGP